MITPVWLPCAIGSGRTFSLRFDKKAGLITHYRYKTTTLLERGPKPDFWRAPTDNDDRAWKNVYQNAAKNDKSKDYMAWRDAGADWSIKNFDVRRAGDNLAEIEIVAGLSGMSGEMRMQYKVYGSGDILVDCSYLPGNEKVGMMPRFGTELVVAPGLENIAWYGRGPEETYIDRQFERIGVYRSTVTKQWTEYMRPQENGNKTDVRWVALTNAQGVGLLAVGSRLLSVGARHYTKEDMARASYSFQMQPRSETFLNLDARQMGVGGIDSWSANALPMAPYRIDGNQAHSFRYRLTPVESTNLETKVRELF